MLSNTDDIYKPSEVPPGTYQCPGIGSDVSGHQKGGKSDSAVTEGVFRTSKLTIIKVMVMMATVDRYIR